MEFRRVGIYWNPTKHAGLEIARELIALLEERHVPVVAGIALAQALGKPELASKDISECDLLIVLGGDGTILSALDVALPNDIPILGINLGRLGFLSEVNPSDLRRDVTDVLEGRYTIDSRSMLTLHGEDERKIFALNEVVISRSTQALHVLSLEVEVNGQHVDRIAGDGVIVATATGSTAYSLSAGGPILLPGLDCFIITPICSHAMNARPVVVSANDRVTIRVLGSADGANAALDGRKIVSVRPEGEGVTVLRSGLQAKFIRLHDRNYFSLLHSKLSEWTN